VVGGVAGVVGSVGLVVCWWGCVCATVCVCEVRWGAVLRVSKKNRTRMMKGVVTVGGDRVG